MNAGKDYAKAKKQAQANADYFRVPYVLHSYGGTWWVARKSTYSNHLPDGAEVIEPRTEQNRRNTRLI